jgi:UDP-N-acetylmuramyl pentapeptide synthase
MIPMTIAEIAKATSAQVKNLDSNTKVTGKVVIDSRKVGKGGLLL